MSLPPRIFLCHAIEDTDKVDQIYKRLYELGLKPLKAPEE